MRATPLLLLLLAGAVRAEAPAAAARLPKFEVTLASQESQVASVSGELQGDRTRVTSDNGSVVSAAPDFVLHLPRTVTALRIEIYGVSGDTRVLLGGTKEYLELGRRLDPGSSSRLAAGDYGVWIAGPKEAKGAFTALVFEGDPTFTPDQRYGEPVADAPVSGRALALFFPYFAKKSCGAARGADAELAHQLFTTLPASFFVFTDHQLGSSNGDAKAPGPGEPFLYMNRGYVLTHDGVCFSAMDSQLTGRPSGTPAFPAIRPLHIVPAKEQNNVWSEEDFVAVADSKAAAGYRAKKKKAYECYDKAWDKLDPDHNAGRYDVATMSGGRVTKVEGLADRFERKASAQCNLTKLWSERDKLEKTTLSHLDAQRKAWLADVEKRFAELKLTQ